MQVCRRLLSRVAFRLLHPFLRRSHFKQGDFVTFRPEGFVAADDPSALLCRNYYEVKRLRQYLARMSELGVSGGRSLEIGCGYGRLSAYIAEYFEEHSAIDINRWALSRARQCYPNISFVQGSATALPFADQTFDVVVSWTVLQHLPNHLVGKALSELIRVAKGNSLILLCEATFYADQQESAAHTHDRSPDFYARSLSPRPLLVSEYISELDEIPNLVSPGRLMLFGPAVAVSST